MNTIEEIAYELEQLIRRSEDIDDAVTSVLSNALEDIEIYIESVADDAGLD